MERNEEIIYDDFFGEIIRIAEELEETEEKE